MRRLEGNAEPGHPSDKTTYQLRRHMLERYASSRRADCHSNPAPVFSAIKSATLLFLGREIPSFFILVMRLVLGNPSLAAAPSDPPPITQPVSSNVRKIRDRVQSLKVADVGLWAIAFWAGTVVRANDGRSGLRSTPSFDRMTARSIRFWSSRTFPGQE